MPTATYDSYEVKGDVEDFADAIYDISPTDTPFMSGIGKAKATNRVHHWQTDSLATASGANQAIEGADATISAVTPTVELNNVCEIAQKAFGISGTNEAISKHGRKSEMAYITAKKGREIKRDMETSLLEHTAKVTGNGTTTARQLAGIGSWMITNVSEATDATAPTAADGASARVDGTARAFTEAQLKTVLQSCWTNGGEPDCIMVGGSNKQVLSGFSGNSTRFNSSDDKKLITSVDVYVSDFGSLEVVPNRFMDQSDALVLQKDMWAVAYLRPFQVIDIGRKGDSTEKQMVVEFTLESRNEKASGIIADLT